MRTSTWGHGRPCLVGTKRTSICTASTTCITEVPNFGTPSTSTAIKNSKSSWIASFLKTILGARNSFATKPLWSTLMCSFHKASKWSKACTWKMSSWYLVAQRTTPGSTSDSILLKQSTLLFETGLRLPPKPATADASMIALQFVCLLFLLIWDCHRKTMVWHQLWHIRRHR